MSCQLTPFLELAQGPSKRRVKNVFEKNDRPGDITEKNGNQLSSS